MGTRFVPHCTTHLPQPGDPLALYVHIPFCDHRCAYCDFNAYAGLDGLMPAYVGALIAEMQAWGQILTGYQFVPTIYFGGGTPSLLPLSLLAQVIGAIRERFTVAADAEWSVEANPGTGDEAYFRGLRALGVNRISIGVQSFDDEELRRLDRIHDGAAAVTAYHAARAAGFANINLDLILGLEGQTLAGWARNLEQAIALAPEHLSLYALTVEEGTPLAQRVMKGEAPMPDPDLQADMYDLAQERLAAAGYLQYEISNWAKPGYECRHNLTYWRDGDWLGLGAGAHSHLGGVRFAVMRSPAAYVRCVAQSSPTPSPHGEKEDAKASTEPDIEQDQSPPHLSWAQTSGMRVPPWIASVERPLPELAMADAAIMALRLSEGMSLSAFAARFGVAFERVYEQALPELLALGLLEREGDRLRIPARRRLLANEVFVRLIPAPTSPARGTGH